MGQWSRKDDAVSALPVRERMKLDTVAIRRKV